MAKILTREQLDLYEQAWRLRDIEQWSYDKIAAHVGRAHSTTYTMVEVYRNLFCSPEDRAKYVKASKGGARLKSKAWRDANCCERCDIIRDAGRTEGCENYNASVICDMCHVELLNGQRFTSKELSPSRLVELGYREAA